MDAPITATGRLARLVSFDTAGHSLGLGLIAYVDTVTVDGLACSAISRLADRVLV